ncbi:phosphoribosylanthranilate isomerase [Lentibacillus juripiscarius]|uniref:N-(5'-phosphoribosyl)anthranilate isomerase n=1 Tax=Lentibacillus juripiscarius TaxID=257446 RepID=A0ABW5V206_9BACI
MLVKICGITTMEGAQVAIQAGTDFIGFVFAPSKRQITPEKAAGISAALPSSVKKVGVFVNESTDTIAKIAGKVGLDYIQLHGDESSAFAEQLSYPVIKAFPMTGEGTAELESYPCTYCLTDSSTGPNRGGNGTSFDWNQLRDTSHRQQIILAGGLNPANVQSAIAITNPGGVDVSSGVETDGKKDPEKIRQFITNAKMKG